MEIQFPRPTSRDPFSLDTLEYASVVELLRGYLSGPIAAPLLGALRPLTDLETIRRDLARAGEARDYLREGERPRLGSLADPRSIFGKLAIEGVSCTALEILALVEVAKAARNVRGMFLKTPYTRLDLLTGGLADFRDLIAELDGKILPDGSLDSSASPALGRIRRSIERLRVEIQATLEKLLHRLTRDGVLQDSVITIRNDRFVLPVRAEEKNRVDGIVHGASSSGATLFIEPMETVRLNNELVEMQDREFAEIQRILGEFTEKLRARSEEIAAATEILSELDIAFAKAQFSREYDCCIPEFVESTSGAIATPGAAPLNAVREISLVEARHPLLEKSLRGQGRRSVPLTIELKEPKSLVIVSGPNTGGKTVALKTIGICVLMGQSGLPVPASYARLPVFTRVLADIGDQQSIQANLSTFSAHVTNIESMAAVADRRSLVLLDELGSSTDPTEGAALAVAILEHFRQRGALTLATTHLSRLKAYAADTSEALNAAVEFDEVRLLPTYRLLVGLPGKSSALDVAVRLGLERSIVAKARTLIDPSEAEAAALVASLHQQKAEFEQEVARLRRERKAVEDRQKQLEQEFHQERRAKLNELDKRLEQTLDENQQRWEKTVAEIRAEVARQAQGAKPAKTLERKAVRIDSETREEWNAQVLEALGEPVPTAETPALQVPPAVGDQVRVGNLSTPGKVLSIGLDGQMEVEVGRLRMHVTEDEVKVLVPAKAARTAASARAQGTSALRPAPQAPPSYPARSMEMTEEVEAPAEINVIGATAEEARDQVDKFLDQAFLAGRSRLRVIHGHGKGILRRTLHEMFTTHPHVEKFYSAPQNEGGTGATIVELRS